jgi:AcrR family transcriptional regulator
MMDNKKSNTDPRILRTRQLIKNAFVDLLQEMDIEKISVNRLAERATINRVTFYLHYRDIPDMLEKMADEMCEEISMILDQTPMNQNSGESGKWGGMVKLLEHFEEHASFYKIILGSNGLLLFRDRLIILLTDRIVSGIDRGGRDSFAEKAGIQKDILIWYDSAALLGTIIAWLQSDMPYTPSFLAKQFSIIHQRN